MNKLGKYIVLLLVIALVLLFSFVWNAKIYGLKINLDFLDSTIYSKNNQLVNEEIISQNSKFDVTFRKADLAFDGLNTFHGKIVDMDGNFKVINETFKAMVINENNVIARDNKRVVKINLNGSLIWEILFDRVHHELYQNEEGNIYTLSSENHSYNGMQVIFDTIVVINQNGTVDYVWSSFSNKKDLEKHHYPSKLDLPKFLLNTSYFKKSKENDRFFYDYYHINSVQSIPNNDLEFDERFKKGNLLVSFAFVDLVAIIDKNTGKIVWSWGPRNIDSQHSPRMLDNGNILIFDNGKSKGISRVIELNPITKKVVWEYNGNPKGSFFTPVMGYAQRLPNGNTLVTESTKGYVFEITREGNKVWEWYNPIVKDGKRLRVYRMERILE